ncbi:MAG: sodium:proton antiporter [Acidobacteria bacterium]|jgi:NhaP-type Na+/H+ or K+/H+ antiporter|nr:sodium:proton antiporter [Acidobacteriota bacterium]
MSFLGWTALCGALLLFMALSSAYLRRLPITTSSIYLAIGLAISPFGFDLIRIDVAESKVWLEHLTEIVVIVSLFVGGLKLRLPFTDPAWTAAFRLAGPVMIASIIGVTVFTHYAFGLEWAIALLLGAILAPTDPVLASTVSVNDAADKDRTRYGLSGEAGFNDGVAFPFVIFALLFAEHESLGEWIGMWALHRLIWAVPAGILLGYILGKGIAHLAIWLRNRHHDTDSPNDFLALALIALSYVGAETIGAWGFLAVFAAGVGFRRAEIKTVKNNPISLDNNEQSNEGNPEEHPPAEDLVGVNITEEEMKHPSKAAGHVVSEIISFGDTAERLLEVLLVVLVGVCLASYWDWRAIPLALVFFFVIRPLATQIFLWKTPTGIWQRLMLGWFGVRGIGSLYYLSYVLNHNLNKNASDVISLTISVVALSILIHGISTQPILNLYERAISSKREQNESEDNGAEQFDKIQI